MNLEKNTLIILDSNTTIELELEDRTFTIHGQHLNITGTDYDRCGQCQLDLVQGSDIEEYIQSLDMYHLNTVTKKDKIIINDLLLKVKELGYEVVTNKSTFEYMQSMYVTNLFKNNKSIVDWLSELPTYEHNTILNGLGINVSTDFIELFEFTDLNLLDHIEFNSRDELFVLEDYELYSCNFKDTEWEILFDKMLLYYVDMQARSIDNYGTHDWDTWDKVIEKETE